MFRKIHVDPSLCALHPSGYGMYARFRVRGTYLALYGGAAMPTRAQQALISDEEGSLGSIVIVPLQLCRLFYIQ